MSLKSHIDWSSGREERDRKEKEEADKRAHENSQQEQDRLYRESVEKMRPVMEELGNRRHTVYVGCGLFVEYQLAMPMAPQSYNVAVKEWRAERRISSGTTRMGGSSGDSSWTEFEYKGRSTTKSEAIEWRKGWRFLNYKVNSGLYLPEWDISITDDMVRDIIEYTNLSFRISQYDR